MNLKKNNEYFLNKISKYSKFLFKKKIVSSIKIMLLIWKLFFINLNQKFIYKLILLIKKKKKNTLINFAFKFINAYENIIIILNIFFSYNL